jgi:hypothetical protein
MQHLNLRPQESATRQPRKQNGGEQQIFHKPPQGDCLCLNPCERFYTGDTKVVKSLLLRLLAFSHNLPRVFIFPQPDKPRMPQVTVRRPFGELDLG